MNCVCCYVENYFPGLWGTGTYDAIFLCLNSNETKTCIINAICVEGAVLQINLFKVYFRQQMDFKILREYRS